MCRYTTLMGPDDFHPVLHPATPQVVETKNAGSRYGNEQYFSRTKETFSRHWRTILHLNAPFIAKIISLSHRQAII